jgi:hypothetical protein
MNDHLFPERPACGCRHDGWQAGQQVALNCRALAGLRGALVRCAGDDRWIVRLAGLAPGVLLVVKVEALRRHTESAAESSPGAETLLPPLDNGELDRTWE